MQSPFNPYLGVASRSPFLDMLSQGQLMPGMLAYQGDTNAPDPQAGPSTNDSMVGGVTDQQTQGAFGTDFMGKTDPAFNTQPAAPTDKMNAAFNNAPAPVAPTSTVPGLPSPPSAVPADLADLSMISGQEAAAAAAAAAESAAPAGVPGSEQNSPNAVGGMMGGMAATGTATGVGSGNNETSAGGSTGGGGGDGGSGPGQGAGSGPSGGDPGGQAGGVGGVGSGGMGTGAGQGEGGNGGWAKGGRITHQSPFLVDPNPYNADDMPIEAQKDEHVVTVKASKGLGRKFLDAANKEFEKKGAKREAILKKLAPLMGKD